jgi:proline iminopeptidase
MSIAPLPGKRILTPGGVELYVQVKGSGAPCLYVHGGPGSGSYWMEKFSDGMLEQYFQMIYLDQRGVGRSTSPADGDYSLNRMAADFEAVRAALGIPSWLTMGHSIGGVLQMGYALRHPEAIRGMLMLNCTLNMTESFNRSWYPKACELLGIQPAQPAVVDGQTAANRVGELIGKLQAQGLFWKMAYATQESEAMMSATFGEIAHWNHDFDNAWLDYPEYLADFTQASRNMPMPVLFFYGRSDWMVGPEHYRQVHFPEMMIWGSEVGHVAILENKKDLGKAIQS